MKDELKTKTTPEDTEQERYLWLSVIRQAQADAKSKGSSKDAKFWRANAKRFLRPQNTELYAICRLLDLYPENFLN